MKLATLEEFLARKRHFPNNAYVKEPGFKSLYVRECERLIQGTRWKKVLDIALVEAAKPGLGTFTKLISKLRKKHPDLGIFVESVLTNRFGNKLLAMGFICVDPSRPLTCYFLPPVEGEAPVKKKPPKPPAQKVVKNPQVKKKPKTALDDINASSPHLPPLTVKWLHKASGRAAETVDKAVDAVVAEIATAWAQGDVRKLVIYLTGAVQAVASQLGRLESILGHSGHVALESTALLAGPTYHITYDMVCRAMHQDDTRYSIQELLKIIAETSRSPLSVRKATSVPDNVIPLPVIPRK